MLDFVAPEKLPQKLPSMETPKHGRGKLLRGGLHGHRGGGGRPPNWLRDRCDELLASPATLAQVAAILADKDHPAFATIWRAVADRAQGKARESVDVRAELAAAVQVWKWGDREVRF